MDWQESIENLSNADAVVENRYRALFFSRQTAPSTAELVKLLTKALDHETSELMRHEICYVLGQCGDALAIPVLSAVLHDEGDSVVTRHEAAEGLAALDAQGSIPALEQYAASEDGGLQLLRQTCELALEGLRREQAGEEAVPVCACQMYEKTATSKGIEYVSKDPAKGREDLTNPAHIPALTASLLDQAAPLYGRYEAMFTLRNLGGSATTEALCRALREDTSSACLRHEVAFVLGQMEDEDATDALIEKLQDPQEHDVVRHEVAIALGSMAKGGPGEVALKAGLEDPAPMVHESCAAALATMAYWHAWEMEEARIAALNA